MRPTLFNAIFYFNSILCPSFNRLRETPYRQVREWVFFLLRVTYGLHKGPARILSNSWPLCKFQGET